VRLHDVRHTVATLLLEQGIHPRAVADRLGHTDATLVLRTYGHTLAAHEQRAADALGGLLTAGAIDA
jgi:integrase